LALGALAAIDCFAPYVRLSRGPSMLENGFVVDKAPDMGVPKRRALAAAGVA